MRRKLVSICCITYNHEKYIKEALDGFLMQETSFEYEILIHDDASTDRTQEIIREYQVKYPNKIRAILQTENQYSKGGKIFSDFLYPNVSGKYVAICEGDDYWTDSKKLQKQVDFMEKHPECTLTFHNATIINQVTQEAKDFLEDNKNQKFSAGELAIKGFIPTASIMYRADLINKFPKWLDESVVGDYPLILITSSFGYAYYLNEIMSVYRVNINGSASNRFLHKNDEEKISYLTGFLIILENFKSFTNNLFESEVDRAIIPWKFQIRLLEGNYKLLKEQKYLDYINSLPFRSRIRYKLEIYIPWMYRIARKISR